VNFRKTKARSARAAGGARPRRWDVRLVALAGLIILTFLTGGGSRQDISSLLILRPAAILVLAFFVIKGPANPARPLGTPFYLLLALLGWALLQQVPLPPWLWENLPGRAPYAKVGELVGLSDIWRPMNMTPARGWNTIFSLSVPLAAYLGYRSLSREQQGSIWWVILACGGLSLALGAIQLVGPPGLFYLYSISNFDSPVGLFSNRNHQALFLACLLVIGAERYLARKEAQVDSGPALRIALFGGLTFTLIMILLAGSRSGLMLGILGCAIAYFMTQRARGPGPVRLHPKHKPNRFAGLVSQRGTLVLLLAIIGSAALLSGRWNVLDRLLAEDERNDLRVTAFPHVLKLLGHFMPAGSGFGSFDSVWRAVEPVEMLEPSYFNHAHDDWLQFPLEGGVPAIVILLVFLFWFGRSVWRTARPKQAASPALLSDWVLVRAVSVVVLCGLASFTDYPLRVPSLMILLSLSCYDIVLAVDRGRRGDAIEARGSLSVRDGDVRP
jgi:hypothetical protein